MKRPMIHRRSWRFGGRPSARRSARKVGSETNGPRDSFERAALTPGRKKAVRGYDSCGRKKGPTTGSSAVLYVLPALAFEKFVKQRGRLNGL